MAETELDSALFNRRIEFHLAKKLFTGFGNKSSNGFKLVTLNPTTLAPTLEPPSACKKNEKSSEENGLDPELSFEISFRRIGAGLRNLGNTCFLNSVLQCLTYTEPLAAYLQSGKHQNSCRTSGFCALCAIQKHVSRALQSTGRTLEPKDLVYNLRSISRNFRRASQEDAHEYMVNLLESMHKCCLPNGVPSESPSAYDKSLVHKIFGGRLQSQVKCMQCSYCSNKFDPFLDLSLEIMKANSLDKALAHFTAKEQLDGGAKEYQCQQCKQKVKALKQLTIHKAPNVLTVHLKRFGSHALVKKIDKKIEFGPTLDLKPFVTDPYDGNLNYTLYGVLVHHGWSTHSGHYYCFVRTSSGMWYALDDNEVFQVNERKVLDQKAYMLFYVRDRKNFCAKKAVNTMQKESMAMNGRVNAAYPKRNTELREKIQNGSEKKLNGSFSVALPEGNGLVSTPIEETPSVNTSLPNINGTMGVEKCLFSKNSCEMNPIEAIQKKHMVVNGNGDAAYSKLNLEFTEKFQNASIEKRLGVSFSGGLSEGDAVVTTLREETHSEETPMPNTDGTVGVDNIIHTNGVVEEQNTAAVILSNSEMPQDSLHMNESVVLMSSDSKDNSRENASVTEKVSNGSVPGNAFKINRSSFEVCVTKDLPVGAKSEVSNKANHVLSSQENSFENIQVGVSSVIATVPMIEGTCDNEQRMDDVSSKDLSGLPATTEPLPHRRKTKKRGLNLKARRKLFKCHIGSTSFSSHIILGAGLCVRNKKHKRRKDISMQKTSNGNILLGNDLASDIGQSVPKELFPGPVNHHTHSKKKKPRSGSDGQNQKLSVQNMTSKDIISNDVIHNEFRERVVQDGTTLSFKKETLVSQSSARESGNSEEHRKESRQTDIVSMLARGLNERTVARWDEVDTSHSQKSETREAGIAQIGHIGDEWDEEYDRGKRKKVRISKISFGGPNVFQELATRNTKRKRAKLERSRFANQPFRI